MRTIELRRHAKRDPDADRLSAEGRAQAEDVGREGAGYDAVFVSPAERAAETAAWILRGAGRQLPEDHAVVPGLAGKDATEGSPEGMATGVMTLLESLPDGGTGLAISHTPFVERAAVGLTGVEPEPFGECEGIRVILHDDDRVVVEELRRPAG